MKRNILVLGGSGDIGSSISSTLIDDYGDNVFPLGSKDLDLSKEKSVENFIKKNDMNFDVIIHSAGMNKIGNIENLSLNDIEIAIQTNLIGFIKIVKATLPYMKKNMSGHIVIISSLYGFSSRHGRLPYAISKHGLIGAMKTMAIEFSQYGILVNAVSPGYINTKMTQRNNNINTLIKIKTGIPVARLGEPQDVGRAVSFLVSPLNRYINGHDLVVDGGFSVGGFYGAFQ